MTPPRDDEPVITYCVVPRDLAATLHEPLRRHFPEDPSIEVVVERRATERRTRGERRRVRAAAGRPCADGRAPLIAGAA